MNKEDHERLYFENENLAYHTIQKFYPTYFQDEDVRQIARIGLWKACTTFNNNKSKFSTYAVTCIRNALKCYFRDSNAVKRKPKEPVKSLNYSDDNNEIEPYELGSRIPSYQLGWVDVEQFIKSLNERQKKIVRMRISGYTQNEIGDELGLGQPCISKEMRDIREKFNLYI